MNVYPEWKDTKTIPPLYSIDHVQAFIPTSEYIRDISVFSIETKNDLLSNKLGASKLEETCLTCDNTLDLCPGHFGHIELPIPTYKIFYVKRLIQILNCICFYCQRTKVEHDHDLMEEILQADETDRLDKILNSTRNLKQCEFCQLPFIAFKYKKDDNSNSFVMPIIQLTKKDYEDYMQHQITWKPFIISVLDIYYCLRFINDKSQQLLGCNRFNQPDACMWTCIPVPPLNTRPTHTFEGIGKGKKNVHNNWTKFLQNIVDCRNDLCYQIQLNKSTTNTKRVKNDIRFNIAYYTYGDNTCRNFEICFSSVRISKNEMKVREESQITTIEKKWELLHQQIAAFHSSKHKKFMTKMGPLYGKPLINVEERFKNSKEGRFRANIVARRVDHAGRGVLDGDIYMRVDQVAIPISEAMKLTIKVYVNKLNAKQVHQWIINGPFQHPGCNYIRLKNGQQKDLMWFQNRRDINLDDILFVRRHLINNDIVFVNRQPTLHRMSMMAYRVIIHKGHEIRLHYAVFHPKGADCDGDEVNFHVPQTMMATAELAVLCSVRENIMKDGVVWVKFIQNSVIGAYLLSQDHVRLTKEETSRLLGILDFVWEYPKNYIQNNNGEQIWTGKQIISCLFRNDFTLILPNKIEIVKGILIKGVLNDGVLNGKMGILHHLYTDYEDKNIIMNFLYYGYLLFQEYIDMFGLSASYLDTCTLDLDTNESTDAMKTIRKDMKTLEKNYNILSEYSDQFVEHNPSHQNAIESNIRSHIDALTNFSTETVFKYHEERNNSTGDNGLMHMIKSGAKGNKNVFNQMGGSVGQTYVMCNRITEPSSYFRKGKDTLRAFGYIQESYSNGIPLSGVLIEANSTCESVLSKNKGTSKSGYTVRKMTNCVSGMVINELGQVVDTNNKVIWETYGNDGYDPQTLYFCKLTILDKQKSIVRKNYTKVTPSQIKASVCKQVYEYWLKNAKTKQKEIKQYETKFIQLWQDTKHNLLKAKNDTFTFKFPFVLEHLFNRCKYTTNIHQMCELNPLEIYQQGHDFWAILLKLNLVKQYNLCAKLLLLDWFSPTTVYKWKFNLQHIQWLHEEIKQILQRNLVQRGESVGSNSHQCLGEPFTQLSLKSTHFSGKFPGAISGTDRFANIIDGSYMSPMMNIILKRSIKTHQDAEIFALSIVRCMMNDLCDSYPSYLCTSTECIITVTVSRDKCIDRIVHIRQIAKALYNRFNLKLSNIKIPKMDLDVATYDLLVTIPYSSTFWNKHYVEIQNDKQLIADDIVRNIYFNLLVSGYYELETFIIESVNVNIKNGTEKRFSIITYGSNYANILRFKEVDTTKTTTNNIKELCTVLGLYAARKLLIRELQQLMCGMADTRHIELLARVMCSNSTIQGMKITQIAQSIPPLQRAAYESSSTQLLKACIATEKDYGTTISGATICNKIMNIGTGYNLSTINKTVTVTEELKRINNRPSNVCQYSFSPKVDGVRTYVTFKSVENQAIGAITDRQNNIFFFNVENIHNDLFYGTVLDGDMVYVSNIQNSDERGKYVFVIFDILMIHGNICSHLRYDHRIELARQVLQIHGNKHMACTMFTEEKYSLPIALYPDTSNYLYTIGNVSFHFIVKPLFAMCGLLHFHQHYLPKFPVPTDGYIFTNLYEPLQPFRNVKHLVFKWKPRNQVFSENTIDVEIEKCFRDLENNLFTNDVKEYISKDGEYCMFVHVRGKRVPFSQCRSVVDEKDYVMSFVGECRWNFIDKTWEIIRIRNKEPNNWETIVNTVFNIKEDLQIQDICS